MQLGPDGVNSSIMIQALEGVSEVSVPAPDGNDVPILDVSVGGAAEAIEVNEPVTN